MMHCFAQIRRALIAAPLALAFIAAPAPLHANAPALQVTPLQYEDTLGATIKSGHIDVANPTDTTITVDATVRGFNQSDTAGNLRFYDDTDLVAAIKLDLTTVNLGPREAVRVLFSVDPAKLPPGGTYAAIFFQTRPADGSSNSSYVAQSANVGTLLLLTNGAAKPAGRIDHLSVPFLQFGAGLHGFASVANTAPAHGGVAYRPALQARVFPWGHRTALPTGLILPGATRQFAFDRPGSFLGLLPLTVTDGITHASRTTWVLACTGWYAWLLLVLMVVALIFVTRTKFRFRRTHHRPRPTAPAVPGESAVPVSSELAVSADETMSKIDKPAEAVPDPAPPAAPELASEPGTTTDADQTKVPSRTKIH